MPPRYFFHAPDSRVYGPIDFPTLQRWRAEGRVRDDSHIRAEGGPLLTYAEVAAAPPAPEATIAPPPILPPIPAVPPVAEAPAEEPPATLGEMIGRAFVLYRRGFLALWIVAAAMQVPAMAFSAVFPPFRDAKEAAAALAHHSALFWAGICLLVVAGIVTTEIGAGILTMMGRQLDDEEPLSAAAAWDKVRGRFGALMKTWLLRWLIIGSLFFVALFCYGAALSEALPRMAKGLLLGMAFLFLVPTVVLFIRYLISTQVVMLEKQDGLHALRRAGDLIRFSGNTGPFSSGDLRVIVFTLLPWVIFGFATNLLLSAGGAAVLSHPLLLSVAASLLWAAMATPLMVILFVLFVREARRRVGEDGDGPA